MDSENDTHLLIVSSSKNESEQGDDTLTSTANVIVDVQSKEPEVEIVKFLFLSFI